MLFLLPSGRRCRPNKTCPPNCWTVFIHVLWENWTCEKVGWNITLENVIFRSRWSKYLFHRLGVCLFYLLCFVSQIQYILLPSLETHCNVSVQVFFLIFSERSFFIILLLAKRFDFWSEFILLPLWSKYGHELKPCTKNLISCVGRWRLCNGGSCLEQIHAGLHV